MVWPLAVQHFGVKCPFGGQRFSQVNVSKRQIAGRSTEARRLQVSDDGAGGAAFREGVQAVEGDPGQSASGCSVSRGRKDNYVRPARAVVGGNGERVCPIE